MFGQRSPLLQFGIGEIPIKVFFTLIWSCHVDLRLLYFDLKCCNVDLGLLYLGLELLKGWSKAFSTLILDCCLRKVKVWDYTLIGECFVVPLFLRCVIFICSFLIWIFFIFSKKTLIDFCSSLRKILSLRLETWNLELETWNLEFETWRLEFGVWNLKLEIWSLEFETWDWKFDI